MNPQLKAFLDNTASQQVLFKLMKVGVVEVHVHRWLKAELTRIRENERQEATLRALSAAPAP